MKEDVKIIYCHDENGNAVHYSKTIKGNKYFCIDCGSELICKDGDIKVKHLAHKNTENCGGTGESIFHKHWKENLFKTGMFINVANELREPDNVEILDVINEVSLNNRYGKTWDREIIVDVLLVTERGDIVIEINYKNPKNWTELKPYYKELNLLRVFEVKVGKNINTQLEWYYLGEEEETKQIKKELAAEKRKKTIEDNIKKEEQKKIKEAQREERKRLKEQAERDRWDDITNNVNNGLYMEGMIFVNYKTPLIDLGDGTYELKCLFDPNYANMKKQYVKVKLRFKVENLTITKNKLEKLFKVTKGIRYSFIIIDKPISSDGY